MNFADIPVSTQTFIVRSTIISLDLEKCFDSLAISDIIVSITYRNRCKGKCKPKTKSTARSGKNFLNCVTLSIVATDKKINMKIFNNGVFQLTGCKSKDHVSFCMDVVIAETANREWVCSESTDEFTYYTISAMRNVDFEMGFKINRNELGTYVSENTNYAVPPMTSGYMGVKIKIPIADVSNVLASVVVIDLKTFAKRESTVTLAEFYGSIKPNPKKLTKKYFVSISVFQNGKILMSGIDESVQAQCFDWFVETIERVKDLVAIKPMAKKTFIR